MTGRELVTKLMGLRNLDAPVVLPGHDHSYDTIGGFTVDRAVADPYDRRFYDADSQDQPNMTDVIIISL